MVRRAAAGFRLTDESKSERLGFGSYEASTDDSYSRKKFRTAFIRVADDLEPDVANTLYREAFFQFILLAWSRYPQAVPPPVSPFLKDDEFLAELERIVTDFSASLIKPDSEQIHPAFVKLLIPVIQREPQHLKEYPRGVLTRELLRPIRELFGDEPRPFRDWAALVEIEDAGPLRERIVRWSERWNLDADWCRDYAVAALWVWLNDRYLQYQVRYAEGRLSLREATFVVQHDNIWSVTAYPPLSSDEAVALFSLVNDQDFTFAWRGLVFRHRRWHPLSSYRDEWERECEESYTTYLERLVESGKAVPKGALTKFRAARGKYVRNIERVAREEGWIKAPRRWATERHLAWAVRLYVQKWPLSEIQKQYSKPRKTIADGIEGVMSFIGLRPPVAKGKAGRRPGSGKTRELSERERADKGARFRRFADAVRKVDNPENKAAVARAIGISADQFRRKWVPHLITEKKCLDYGMLLQRVLRAGRGSGAQK